MQSGSSQASLEDSIKLSFSFWMVGQSLCITRKTLTTLSLYCAFRNLDRFRTHKIEGTCLSIANCNVLHLWHNDRFLHHLEQHHVQNEQFHSPDNCLVSSVVFIQPLFVSVSPSVSSITPTLHHLVLTTASSFFSESISTPKHCKGASTSPKRFGKFFPFVSLCQFFAQAMLHMTLSFVCLSFMCSSLMTRTAVTLSATLLLYSSNLLSCLSTILSENIPEQLILFLQIFPIIKRVPKRRIWENTFFEKKKRCLIKTYKSQKNSKKIKKSNSFFDRVLFLHLLV